MPENPFHFDESDDESAFTNEQLHESFDHHHQIISDTPENQFTPVETHFSRDSIVDDYLDDSNEYEYDNYHQDQSNIYSPVQGSQYDEHETNAYHRISQQHPQPAVLNSKHDYLNPFEPISLELQDLSSEPTYNNMELNPNLDGSGSYQTNLHYETEYNDSKLSAYTLSPEKPILNPPTNDYYQYSPASSNMYLAQPSEYGFGSGIITSDFERDDDEPEVASISIQDDDDMDSQQCNAVEAGDIKVKLLDDKYYSFDYPVSKSLVNKLPFEKAKEMSEFTHLRYHAITANPKDYKPNEPSETNDYIDHYPFRQTLYKYPRETELMIVCTMYNEDEVLLARTLKGVFKNIKHMMKKKSDPWGGNTWKKVVVLIVSDGRAKINPRSKALLTLLGVFQEDIMQEQVNDQPVNAHLFEYTTTLGIGKFKHDMDGHTTVPIGADNKTVPVQLMFLLKEQNKQKINSHRWALNFIAPNLKPEVVVLLDVGTEPGPTSIYKLWEAFKDPKVGGACGEIRAMLGNHASMNDDGSILKKIGRKIGFLFWDFTTCVLNPLVAAQNFEYKISNILDKPMESAFGFVTVLPGAFSAYRYKALQGDPLAAYFHGEDMKSNFEKPAGVLESNMYLAEDRILCFELVAKRNKSYLLRYVHDSYAVTDVPSQIPEFINQRRRWLNGSFFAAVYSILHFYRLLTSSHSIFRKIFLIIEITYQTISVLMSWFNLSMYFLVFRILTLAVIDTINENVGNILAVVFLWVYIGALGLSFVLSFGNKPSEAKWLYTLVFALFSSIMIYMAYCVVMLSIESFKTVESDLGSLSADTALKYFENENFRNLTISLASTYFLYILGSLIFFDVFHLFACTVQYLLLSPAYINVLAVFAFCNIHDISWGTKGALTSTTPTKAATVTNASGSNGENELLLSEKLADPDSMYQEAAAFLNKPEEDDKSNSPNDNMKISEQNYALGRTYTVVLWLLTNFVLIVVVLRTGGLEDLSDSKTETTTSTTTSTTSKAVNHILKRNYWSNNDVGNIFMSVILWIVAGMALFRFIGCVYYRISFFFNRRFHSKDKVIDTNV